MLVYLFHEFCCFSTILHIDESSPTTCKSQSHPSYCLESLPHKCCPLDTLLDLFRFSCRLKIRLCKKFRQIKLLHLIHVVYFDTITLNTFLPLYQSICPLLLLYHLPISLRSELRLQKLNVQNRMLRFPPNFLRRLIHLLILKYAILLLLLTY